MKIAQSQPKVLMLGANALVRDNVRVLLGSMGYQYLVAPTLKEALTLLEQGRPDAAILDPQQADSPPARVAKPEPRLSSVPIVIQGHEGLMGMAKTNEWGEFRFEFNFEPGVSLEIGARQNYWVSVGLPDSKSVTGGTTEESKAPADSEAQKDVHPKGKKRGRRDGKL